MKKNIVKAWEKRSRLFKDSKKAVMEQAFPPVVNDYIESIHLAEIEKLLDEKVKKCLDVGCGYGRLAQLVAKKYPKVLIYGVDVSSIFVNLFNNKLKKRGKAYVGDIRSLPFNDNSFDVVWVVVTFMYLESSSDQEKGMKELLRVIKPGGRLILIEPNQLGVNIVRLWGFVPFLYRKFLGKSKVETYGVSFTANKIDELISHSHGKVIYKRGYPMLTLLLLPNIFLGRFLPILTRLLLSFTRRVDSVISSPSISYFVVYVAIKKL